MPLSLQILGWQSLVSKLRQIESIAGLAVFPLVPLMTATQALRANLRALAASKCSVGLPCGSLLCLNLNPYWIR